MIKVILTLDEAREALKSLKLRQKKLHKSPDNPKAQEKIKINQELTFKVLQGVKSVKENTDE